MNMVLIIIGVLIVAFMIINIVARKRMKNIPTVVDNEKIMTLTDKNFQNQTKNKLVLVDFWASWCAPCRMMAPILNDTAIELDDSASIGKVNIEQNQSLAQKFKVRNIPTMILFRNGVEVTRFTGVKSKEFLLKQIQDVG